MNFNGNNILQMIMQGKNPQQLVLNYLQSQMGNTPMGQNLAQLAQKGDFNALEQIARNICQQKGLNFDEQSKIFKQSLNIR